MRKFLYFIVFIALVSCQEGRYALFENGRSEYVIVLEGDATDVDRYAAQELQFWLKQVSGAAIPISEEASAGKRLILRCEDSASRDDSFRYYSDGADIHFVGKGIRATLYAVYAFLEEELGCRWYAKDASVAPARDSWRFGRLQREESPGIRIRDNCYLDPRTRPVFSARLRNNFVRIPSPDGEGTIPGSAEGYWGVHALGTHVPVEKYFGRHPEYFCLRDGKRYGGYGQPCLSNPDVLALTIESVRRIMREQPDYLIYSVEQNDNQLFCQCPECEALAQKYGGQSGVMVWFVNQVADAVKDEFPDKFIGTFAYQYTRHAPKGIQPRDNVVIRLCSIECCMLHPYDACERNRAFLKDLEDWGTVAPHLYIWDYVTDFSQYCVPVANWYTLQPHIKDFQRNHAIGILEEGDYQTPTCELVEMRTWLLSKLMWNPDACLEDLIQDFTDGYYGPGGRYVRDYLALEERILRREGVHGTCYISPADSMFTLAYIRDGRALFAEAKKAVGQDSVLLRRLEKAEFPLCYLQMEKDPLRGIETEAHTLVRRVIKREGYTRMNEWERGGKSGAESLLERYAQLEKWLNDSRPMPAVTGVAPEEPGVRYVRYEGPFLSTEEMPVLGREVARGTQTGFSIEEDPGLDHFGYVFQGFFKAPEDGFYQIRITSDDGAVLLVDGKEFINLDGSHSIESAFCFLHLEKGFHRLELRYFEDCEGQVLAVSVNGPDGNVMHLPDYLYI